MELIGRGATWIVLVSLVASPLFGDARDDYKSALAALEAGKVSRAKELLQRAIDQDPQAKKPMIGRDYLPHFYLGQALFELGDCRGALGAWHESQRQGAVDKAREELERLGRNKKVCEQRLSEFDDSRKKAQAKIEEATQVSSRVGRLESDELLSAIWDEGDDSLKDRQTEAVRPLWTAKERIVQAEASADMAIVHDAQQLAAQSIEALLALEAVANQRRLQIETKKKDLEQQLRQAVSHAEKALRATDRSADSRPVIDDLRDRLHRLLRDATSVEGSSDADIKSLGDRIDSLANGLEKATKMPPKELQLAAASYLQGDYRSVLEILDTIETSDNRVTSQICLLRSSTLHAMDRLGMSLPPRPAHPGEEVDDRLGAVNQDESSLITEPPLSVSAETETGEPDSEGLETPSASHDVLTAIDVLLACDGLDDRLQPGTTFFPPSYQELFAEFRSIQALAVLDETP